MMNEINIDKILERQQNQNIYILHIIANSQTLSIQIEDKIKGDIWMSQYTAEKIQQITLKAKNPKKYAIFIKMLTTSLMGQTQSVLIQILTYAQLQRKMNISSTRRNINNNKKYLIMTYMSQFDKAHFPLTLDYVQSPSIERLRITIRRLSQQLQLNAQQRTSPKSIDAKQISMLKYQNQTLKARIKNLQGKINSFDHNRQGQNIIDKSNILEVKQQQSQKQIDTLKNLLMNKDNQIELLKSQIKQLTDGNIKKDRMIIQLKEEITQYKQDKINHREDQQTFQLLQEKINQMNRQTEQLVAELQHYKQMQKKSALKIVNLQKELQKMMNIKQQNKKNTPLQTNKNYLNSSRRSESGKSVKSYTSQKSNQSNNSNNSKNKGLSSYLNKGASNNPRLNQNNINNKKVIISKKSSIYDSDTESSKLRKADNTKVSPFRQTNKPSQRSNSSKKKPQNYNATTMNRFQGNLLNNSRDRSRSKSRSVKKQNSPPIQMPTDNFASSSEDQRNISEALTKLKERKNRVKLTSQDKGQNRQKSKMDPLEKKITNIAEMLRKAKSRQID